MQLLFPFHLIMQGESNNKSITRLPTSLGCGDSFGRNLVNSA